MAGDGMRRSRTPTGAARLAWGIAITSGILLAIDLVLLVANRRAEGNLPATIGSGVAPAALAVLGALVASRRPRNPIGWVMLASAAVAAVMGLAAGVARHALLDGASVHGWVRWPAWLVNWMSIAPLALVVLVFLLFPDGRLPFRTARWAAWSLVLILGSLTILTALDPSKIEVSSHLPKVPNITGISAIRGFESGGGLLGLLWFTLLIPLSLAIATLVIRLRRARGEERRALTWVVYVGLLSMAFTVVGVVVLTTAQAAGSSEQAPGTSGLVGSAVLSLGTDVGLGLAVPAVVAMTILRYRMFDIERIVNRTLVYGLLTAVLAGVYAALVLALGTVTRTLGGRSGRAVVVAASTLAVAALVRPLRRRVQSTIDRRFYRRRYDAERTIGSFASRLRSEIELEDLRRDLAAVVSETMQPASVSVWLGRPAAPPYPAQFGDGHAPPAGP
jgi:hypothetical protein